MSTMWKLLYHTQPEAREAVIARAVAALPPREAEKAQTLLRSGLRAPKGELVAEAA